MANTMCRYVISMVVLLMPMVAHADTAELDAAMANVRQNCAGISAAMHHLKTMAGINTAVTGVGTAVGVGALGTGIAKIGVDKKAEELEKEIERLRELAAQQDINDLSDIPMDGPVVDLDFDISMVPEARLTTVTKQDIAAAEAELAQLEKKSKNLGNWRTGLMATNTVTNVAGTVIAANNQVKGDLKSQIDACIASVDALARARVQAMAEPDVDTMQLESAKRIVDVCGDWSGVNLSSINTKAKGAMISSGVGAGVGAVGTIVSAVANTNKTRNDNTESGKSKEKNLNTAANVMAGGATVASGVATVFNATQIGAIKKAVSVADACEEVLK